MNNNTVCKADVTVSFINEGKSTTIDSLLIKYLIIESLYQTRFMPVIYLSLILPPDLYTEIINNEKKAKMYLEIKIYNAYSNTSISKDSIKDQFTYIISNSNLNYKENATETNSGEIAYRPIMLALMSMTLLNKSKTAFNGIYGNIDQNTLISKVMGGLKSIVKKPKYNPKYETILIPPLNSRTKLLNFLFLKCPFYDTEYIYFMDFKKTYLLDLTGDAISGNDGEKENVYINIPQVTTSTAFSEGVQIKKEGYYLYINPGSTNVKANKSQNKISNQLVFVSDEGTVDAVSLNVNNNIDSDVKQSFRRGGNAVLYKNMAESNTITIEVMKENIDGAIFSPNKGYYIKNYEGFEDYNGKYVLAYKRQIIKNVHGDFGLSVGLGLRKVGTITPIGYHIVSEASNNSRSASYRYSGSNKTTSTTAVNSSGSSTTTTLSSSNPMPQKDIPTVRHIKASEGMSLQRRFDSEISLNNNE